VEESNPTPIRRKATIVAATIVGLLILAIAYIVVLQSRYSSLQTESARTIQAHVQTILLQTQQIEALDHLATRVEKFNHEFGATVGRLQLNDNLQANVKELAQKDNLSDAAKKTLEEFEQNIVAIQEMAAKIKEFEHYLGSPTTVKSGDNHVALARHYLLEDAKLSQPEADAVIKRTALAWELEPGNQVFNFYHEGVLLSTVTQGTAKRAPLMVQWSKRQAMAAKVQELEGKVQELEGKLATASGAAPAPAAAPAAPH
jgi:hypothetical protein